MRAPVHVTQSALAYGSSVNKLAGALAWKLLARSEVIHTVQARGLKPSLRGLGAYFDFCLNDDSCSDDRACPLCESLG